MDTTDEIVKLVRTVAGLPRDDQNRILRLVDLLSLAPFHVQQQSLALVRSLIDANPRTKSECAAGIDELIAYLERTVVGADERPANWIALRGAFLRSTVQ
ncbi:MAG: hypothetical protein LOD94_08390 [Gammaproteobacteria bacterium]|nr:hypothetical protein [Gammaproteobacteria bacterium]